jgi:hypothetical protein
METSGYHQWLSVAPLLVIGSALLAAMALAAVVGALLRARRDRLSRESPRSESQEAYIVSGVVGLLALLLGFTLSLAVDRFDARRHLVLEDANAISTTYLRAQLLGEPHRTRISNLLIAYTDNLITLGEAPRDQIKPLLAKDDQLLTDIWAATAAAFDSIRTIDFSSSYVDATNNMIDLDSARRAARQARVPSEVFDVLFVYLVVTAGVLGYVLSGWGGRLSGGMLMILATMSLLLVLDIDRPTGGGVRESQAAMRAMRASLVHQPPKAFDRWRDPQMHAAP